MTTTAHKKTREKDTRLICWSSGIAQSTLTQSNLTTEGKSVLFVEVYVIDKEGMAHRCTREHIMGQRMDI